MGKHDPNKALVSGWMDKEFVDRIDRLAAIAEISRSQLVQNILRETIPALEKMEKLRLFKFSCVLRDLGAQLIAWSEDVKEDPTLFGLTGYLPDDQAKEWINDCNDGKGCGFPCPNEG